MEAAIELILVRWLPLKSPIVNIWEDVFGV